MRVVLDANVFISGLISEKGPPGQILNAWLDRRFVVYVSPGIFDEIQRIIKYPRIQKHLVKGQIQNLIHNLERECRWTPDILDFDLLTIDPSDNIYLACAIESKANYLVTGNLDHFTEVPNPYLGVRILSPREFLRTFRFS